MPIDPVTAMAAGQAVVGLGKTVAAAIDKRKARRELESLESPFYKIQEELLQNRDIAAQQAQLGVPQAIEDYMTTETQRGFGSSIMASNNQRLGANSVAELFDRYQRGVQANAAQQAQMVASQIGRFLDTNSTVAGQKVMQWTINEFNPFQNKVRNLQARIGQNNATMGSGISDLLSAGSTYAVGQQNNALLQSLGGNAGQPSGGADNMLPFYMERFGGVQTTGVGAGTGGTLQGGQMSMERLQQIEKALQNAGIID